MVRRYAHMSVKHLQSYADQLIFPVTPEEPAKSVETLDSPEHKSGHTWSQKGLRLVGGTDVSR
jgi:hypothetical protein